MPLGQNRDRTLLLIEDNELNREMLSMILSPTYHVITAENGQVGLELLEKNHRRISLILLDIQMPVMNGYQFLDAIQERPNFANIPIIVTTSSATATDEIKCLENGAADFVSKPYNPDIILRRVSSMIRLSESSSLISRTAYDGLTSLYNKEYFYIHVEDALKNDLDGHYDMLCSDIKNLRIINDRYGEQNGDVLISTLAGFFKAIPHAIQGRIGEDSLAVLIPHQEDDFYKDLLDQLRLTVKASTVPTAVVQLGLWRNVSHALKASDICDNAISAISSIKQKHEIRIAEYNEAFKQKIIREHIIADGLETGLQEGQFHVYYQMKYDLQKNCIGGCEALVRWIHPEYGFMNPGEFISLFEKNYSIAKLDLYIVEQVCKDLRNWIDEGKKVVPISVNISRVDFESPKLIDQLTGFVDAYHIPHNLIHFEVTESAYAENPDLIYRSVEKLREYGFLIELDDFGSGYSSLTVLDTLSFDVLKLDMNLVRNVLTEKRHLILEHIFAIAKRLKMTVVAEGIETKEEAKAFTDMGCTYAQGYYYSKPLPKAEFEKFLNK